MLFLSIFLDRFEFGSGFACAGMYGSHHNDPFTASSHQPDSTAIAAVTVTDGCSSDSAHVGSGFPSPLVTVSNHSGGVQGGISNGASVVFRVAFKPAATIGQDQDTGTQRKTRHTILKLKKTIIRFNTHIRLLKIWSSIFELMPLYNILFPAFSLHTTSYMFTPCLPRLLVLRFLDFAAACRSHPWRRARGTAQRRPPRPLRSLARGARRRGHGGAGARRRAAAATGPRGRRARRRVHRPRLRLQRARPRTVSAERERPCDCVTVDCDYKQRRLRRHSVITQAISLISDSQFKLARYQARSYLFSII